MALTFQRRKKTYYCLSDTGHIPYMIFGAENSIIKQDIVNSYGEQEFELRQDSSEIEGGLFPPPTNDIYLP